METLVGCSFHPGAIRTPDLLEDRKSIEKWVPILTVTEYSCEEFVGLSSSSEPALPQSAPSLQW